MSRLRISAALVEWAVPAAVALAIPLAALLTGTTIGCSPKAEAPRRDLTVGAHRLNVAVSPGWEVVDLGRRVLLRSGPNQVSIQDLGQIRRHGRPLDHAEMDSIQARGLDSLAEAGLADLAYDRRTDIERRRSATVDGQKALVLDTWNRLTHMRYRRVAIIVNDGYLLAVQTEQGQWEVVTKQLDDVVGTLRFAAARDS